MKTTEEKKIEAKERSKKWREENKKKVKDYAKNYRELNKDETSNKIKKWHEKNPDYNKNYSKNYSKTTKAKESTKKWRENNKEKIKEARQIKLEKNPDYDKNISKKWRENNPLKAKESTKKWRENNKEKDKTIKKNYVKNKKISDPLYKLKANIRTLISNSFKNKPLNKNSKTTEILGCSFEEFKMYLESKFLPWMNWNNRGLYNGELNYGWDIDHIKPLSTSKSKDELLLLNHYTNLQPMCSKVNRDLKRNSNIYDKSYR